jgi:aminopeptidase N
MKKYFIVSVCLAFAVSSGFSQPLNQKTQFTRQDSLRGSLNAERDGWDVDFYTIDVTPDYLNKSIAGRTVIGFKTVKDFSIMQLDLQEPMEITSITWRKKKLSYKREGNAFHVQFPEQLKNGRKETIVVFFSGNPRVAVRPPWDGGWIFQKDNLGRPWMSVACQGLGASVWYPCKDHQSDEPDHGATINVTVPDTLVAVANGKMTSRNRIVVETMTYRWTVANPINNYNIVPYIRQIRSWEETFNGEKGKLNCDYWVLDYELEKRRSSLSKFPKC